MIFGRSVLVLTLSVLIAGCATSPEQQAKLDGDRCTARGLQANSKAHDDCLSQIAGARDARLQRRHQELVERPVSVPGR